MFNPGQGPRMSPGRKGSQGWSLSLTSFADVSFKGPGEVQPDELEVSKL